MLKRQRPTTPPPASTPDDPSPFPLQLDEPRHLSKRQRTSPPPLDGPSRGWVQPPRAPSNDDSDEEYLDEDEMRDNVLHGHGGVYAGPPTMVYKEVNLLLHDLHAEHQHRSLFMTASPSSQMPPSFSSPHAHPHIPTEIIDHHRKFASHQLSPSTDSYQDGTDKSQLDHHQYEQSNRLLRDVFLTRRRQLSEAPPG